MPELPDVTIYVERTAARTVGHPLRALELRSAFVLRTAVPPASDLVGRDVVGVRRLGKRVVLEFAAQPSMFLVIHLMIAGRLHWHAAERAVPRHALAVMRFDHGNLVMTEAGTRKRASLHVVQGDGALDALDPKGLEPLSCSYGDFAARLKSGNHTLKRALTDPRTLSGIGNSYSDEILHRAQLSPLTLTQALDEPGLRRLYDAMRTVLDEWTRKLRSEAGDDFPQKVTAFRDGMAVHGRYGQPCPVCGAPVQRILYADNETNYCARCQTGGRVLADRALSRLLKASFPRDIDQLG